MVEAGGAMRATGVNPALVAEFHLGSTPGVLKTIKIRVVGIMEEVAPILPRGALGMGTQVTPCRIISAQTSLKIMLETDFPAPKTTLTMRVEVSTIRDGFRPT